MATLNRKYGYLFYAEPRTASRCVTRALMQHSGSESLGEYHVPQEKLEREHDLDGLVTFSFRRYPFEILASLMAQSGCTWESAIFKQYGDRPQFFRYNSDVKLIFENGIQSELDKFCRGIEAPLIKLGRNIGKTKFKKPWQDYFNIKDIETLKTMLPELYWGYWL